MKKILVSCAMAGLLLLGGCSDWDDFVDSISGSDDDDEATVATQPADTTNQTTAPAGTTVPPSTTTTTTGTTGTSTNTGTSTSSSTSDDDDDDPDKKEVGSYSGRYNGDRPTWYFSKNMKSYPSTFYITISGCVSDLKVSNNGSRWEGSGIIAKQSDVSGRGLAVVGASSCSSSSAYIEY